MRKLFSRFLIRLVSILALAGLFYACNSDLEPDPSVVGYTFFPLEVGLFIEYQAKETTYSLINPPQIQNFQLREEITEKFTDISGQEAYKIERFRRNNNTSTWQKDSIWVAKRSPIQAIRVENNLSFVKLRFPPEEGLKWNGNVLNALEAEEYEIKDFDLKYAVDTFKFNRSLKVIQSFDSSLVSLDKRMEIFAENVGMVYKEVNQVTYCMQGACLGTGKIDFGKVITYKIINYGKK